MHFSILQNEGYAYDFCTNITAATPARLTSKKLWGIRRRVVLNNNVWAEDSRAQVSCFDYIIITMEVRETIFCVCSENVLQGHLFNNFLIVTC